MALNCLNCHMACAKGDPVCLSCGYKITDTATARKTEGGMSKMGKGMSVMFMIVGSAIFNSAIGPTHIADSGTRTLVAGAVGAVCAVLGLFVGQIISGD